MKDGRDHLVAHAQRVVESWPSPTQEQLQRVAAILLARASPPTQAPPVIPGGSTTPTDRKAAVAARIAELDGGGVDAA